MSSRIRGISSFWGKTKGLSEIKWEKGEKERGKRWGPKRGLGAPQALENTKKEEKTTEISPNRLFLQWISTFSDPFASEFYSPLHNDNIIVNRRSNTTLDDLSFPSANIYPLFKVTLAPISSKALI